MMPNEHPAAGPDMSLPVTLLQRGYAPPKSQGHRRHSVASVIGKK